MHLDKRILTDEMKRLHSGGEPHEDDFRWFRKFDSAGATPRLVDIGANAGQSAISFLGICPHGKVQSFEPNKLYEPILADVRTILGEGRFSYFMYGLSDVTSSAPLYIPEVDGELYMQESSMTLDQFEKPWVKDRLLSYGERLDIVSLNCDFKVGDEAIADDVDIIKIDAEGAEMKVLLGLRKVIARDQPVFLIENNDYAAVTEFLSSFGYEVFKYTSSLDKLEPMNGATANCFYLLPEKHAELLEA